ncbi:UDP-N-acetylmuramoyl-L-alanine--D-glutamate ligase [Limobrevibacterium gyesilva]|uniref:UDP-N-acetylmuramoylalanine--D-glutamate ligase n=1 Tax=Limobrevibacterium gyesilva TaxID=2991712 RepID=A0AA42CI28_9PROT|nr:UDP-N-acetylmuramoyl-L-alanine--D-glutamate ligase [Limobrevibacterium gyesilva]MCW3477916.1 UDP-N-acetylmuramoyl-L-alanine--D-glutamate ligase [Limobrevibacterium gyesilva]
MMFPEHIFAGARFAVVGLGRNGLPAAQALQAMGADITAWDDSEAARAAAASAGLRVGEPDMDGLSALVLSPGIPHRLPRAHPLAARAIAAGVPILSDADLLYRAVRAAGSQARFAGVTGTNGKSTTTALLAHILAVAGRPVAAGGNLGTAALALPLLPQDAVYVLEMSSYMLERIAALRFDTACMLNLSPDHLDRHGDMTGYALAKRAIFDRQDAGDVAVLGVDDGWSRAMAEALRAGPAPVVTISGAGRADVFTEGGVLRDADGPIVALAGARALPGAHNAQNAAAAAAMAAALGVPRAAIAEGIESYPGLPHRQERVGTVDGVVFVNDSKATNADSTARALGCYDRLIWIAGGMAKQGGIAPLAEFFPRVALALLIGRDAPILAETLQAHGVPYRDVGTLENAVAEAWAAARAGTAPVVLLSPACASWDQFTGFDQRGDRFRAMVQDIGHAALAPKGGP